MYVRESPEASMDRRHFLMTWLLAMRTCGVGRGGDREGGKDRVNDFFL